MSLPWPLLSSCSSGASRATPWLLGLAGAARMLPYVLCSWAGGRLADRDAPRPDRPGHPARPVGSAARRRRWPCAVGQAWLAVLVAATLAVAVATPAYPALAAAMPGLAGGRPRGPPSLLVTVEVASFVVGPALGGLLLRSRCGPGP